MTPLSNAAGLGGIDTVLLLLNYGAVIETRDDGGRTPLSHAAASRAVDVVQLLLEFGAEIETRDNGARTPLSHAAEFAASSGYSAMVCFLLAWPTINIDSKDDEGLTAIGWADAISEGHARTNEIASEGIVTILKTALLEKGHNLCIDGGDSTILSSKVATC